LQPAYSIIFFTTASGCGYGLMFWLGLASLSGRLPADRGLVAVAMMLALALVAGGLLSSTLHLGRPARAWRALTQWRSSWLSREAVAALLTFPPALAFAFAGVWLGRVDGWAVLAGGLMALGALATVVTTAMIYRTLKAVPRWHHPLVPACYLALAGLTGAVWLALLLRAFGHELALPPILAVLAAAFAALVKLAYWRSIDRSATIATAESATGLGAFGRVRLLEPPHTGRNFLLQEMGYRVARKHTEKLRLLAGLCGFALPALTSLASMAVPYWPAVLLLLLGAVAAGLGAVVERWLFFAEAKHTQMLYYGEAAA